MKTLGISCGGLLLLVASLAALGRFWLIMTVGVGFAAAGSDGLVNEARAWLLTGGAGLTLFLGTTLFFPLLHRRRKLLAGAGVLPTNAAV